FSIFTFVQLPRIVKYSENDRLARHLTVLFLAIFIFVKANPYYYICQYFPPARSVSPAQIFTFNAKDNHQSFLVRVQKSIIEETPSSSIPAIKFTGTPFVLFALGVLLIVFSRRIYSSFVTQSGSPRLCFAYCVLRL